MSAIHRLLLATVWLASVILCAQPAVTQVFIEDFENDVLGNSAGGFDTQVFTHNFFGTTSMIVDDGFAATMPHSPHHHLYMGANTADLITFHLTPACARFQDEVRPLVHEALKEVSSGM